MNILVPVDFDNPITLDKQCLYIKKNYNNTKIILLNVIPGFSSPFVSSFFDENSVSNLKNEILNKLAKYENKYFSDFEVQNIVLIGKRVGTTILLAKNKNIDLIVLGCRKKRSRENQRMLGSTTYGVSDRANCSVLLVR